MKFPHCPLEPIAFKCKMAGFETQLAKNLVLEVSKNSVQNFGLKVASTSEVVTVEATAPVIEATTMTVGQTINQRTVQDIPLNGRHFVDLGPADSRNSHASAEWVSYRASARSGLFCL